MARAGVGENGRLCGAGEGALSSAVPDKGVLLWLDTAVCHQVARAQSNGQPPPAGIDFDALSP